MIVMCKGNAVQKINCDLSSESQLSFNTVHEKPIFYSSLRALCVIPYGMDGDAHRLA